MLHHHFGMGMGVIGGRHGGIWSDSHQQCWSEDIDPSWWLDHTPPSSVEAGGRGDRSDIILQVYFSPLKLYLSQRKADGCIRPHIVNYLEASELCLNYKLAWIVWWGQARACLSVNQRRMHVYSLHKQTNSVDHNSAKESLSGLRHRPVPTRRVISDSSSRPWATPFPLWSRICRPFAGTGPSCRCQSAGGTQVSALCWRRKGLVFVPEGLSFSQKTKGRGEGRHMHHLFQHFKIKRWSFSANVKSLWLFRLSPIFSLPCFSFYSLFNAALRQHQSEEIRRGS